MTNDSGGTIPPNVDTTQKEFCIEYIRHRLVEQTQEDGPRYLVRRGRADQSERARSASHCPYLRTYCASSRNNKRETGKDSKRAGSLSSVVCNWKVISGQRLTLRLEAPRHRLRSHRVLHVRSTAGQSPQLFTAIDDTKEFCSILKSFGNRLAGPYLCAGPKWAQWREGGRRERTRPAGGGWCGLREERRVTRAAGGTLVHVLTASAGKAIFTRETR